MESMAKRYNCERCGENYNEENLGTCIQCGRLVCCRCADIVTERDDDEDEWMCNACAGPLRPLLPRQILR